MINYNHTFINPDYIESIDVKKDLQPGEIHISTKEKEWKYKSLERFLRTLANYDQIYDKTVIPIFIIDNQIIDQPDSVKIDSSFYGEATLKSLSDVYGITGDCKNITIVTIKLSMTPIIYIRGSDIQIPARYKK